jgi:hypothetical protein
MVQLPLRGKNKLAVTSYLEKFTSLRQTLYKNFSLLFLSVEV